MAATALLVLGILANSAIALIPPCLPQLGPEFCPSTARAAAAGPKFPTASVAYPKQMYQEKVLRDLVFPHIDKTRMFEYVKMFATPNPYGAAGFPNRHCNSHFGKSAEQALSRSVIDEVSDIMEGINSTLPISLREISNYTPQQSNIFRILPEDAYTKPHDVVIIGAHIDSIVDPWNYSKSVDDMIAPGADDNASAFAVLIETMLVLTRLFGERRVLNEVQFHFWAAEEIDLVGSSSVFETMRNESQSVKAVLNMDMVGYSAGHKAGFPIIAVHKNHTNTNLTDFTSDVIRKYSNATVGTTACGYPCSDHASAWDYGFPSAGLGESAFLDTSTSYPYIHTPNDTMDHLDFDYMVEFVKVCAGFAGELAYTNFTALN